MTSGERLARGLGLFSLGLGTVQLLAPDEFSRWIGVRPKPDRETATRLVGARELGAAAGLLSGGAPAPWMWARVAGDLMDLALLTRAMTARDTRPERVGTALASVAGITAVDLLGSVVVSREQANGNGKDGNGLATFKAGTPTGAAEQTSRPVVKTVTINRPRAEVYAYWRDFERLPMFMKHLEDVTVIDERLTHWRAKGPAGTIVEWDAETLEDRPNELISWRSVPGASVTHAGTVRFEDAPGGRGTVVRVEMGYNPPGGPIGVVVAKVTGEEPATQTADDLRHFKQVLETGEVVRSEGSIGGRKIRQRPARPEPVGAR
jgi:uncharacterized membrane protein